jgi:glycosyltransferase involved in cell wall biosynthesis
MEVSIVIPTYNREKNIFKILQLLSKQICTSSKIEIIICDSNSRNRIKLLSFIQSLNRKNIIYTNIKINHQALKRNYGVKISRAKNIIFIDDDCMPSNKFLYYHLRKLNLERKKEIYCGSVKYYKSKNNNNLVNYRDSRLIKLSDISSKNIPAKNFISMNMSCKLNILKSNIFDPRFRHYGFEDFEFAYRLKTKFKFILIEALINHKDDRSFDDFLKKHYYLGKFGIQDIIKINQNAYKHSIFYKIENNFLIKYLKKIIFFKSILKIFISFLIRIEKKLINNHPLIYRAGIFLAFLSGSIERSPEVNSTYKDLVKWYK